MMFATRLIAAARSAKATTAVAVLVAAASMATAPATARAGSITYTTSLGAQNGTKEPLDAKAVFTLKSGEIDITLTNLLWNPNDDAQMISALRFTVTGVTGTASLNSISGNTSTINSSDGTYSTPSPISSSTPWKASNTGTSLVLNDLTGSKPKDLIIGPDNKGSLTNGGIYTHAQGSISQHNPVILGSASFVIDVAGVTSSSKLSNVVFQFGTTAGSNQSTGILVQSVPEPSTMVMGLSALAMMAGVAIRRRRRTA